ncbi:uncharacterized protein HD556DRAFT_1538586 [Suillus plorans]|uniref:Uncharacterized protein n=1 Tax=Suillus plorans TaxID=116603 RepID=A0A9P7DDQ0_9AGAM|nr:uncharacterized protein HD556DRAFT_1538586 [Suillus plorans]KAG1788634.1 hypothetical protein HD556DRAFT_1538586 [Suillus plorans]
MARQELFSIVKCIYGFDTQVENIPTAGVKKDSLGCEYANRLLLGNDTSILSSLYNELVLVLAPVHHANQDASDKYLANIQRNGTFSVVPRVAGGEIAPDKLIVLGQVANKCGASLLHVFCVLMPCWQTTCTPRLQEGSAEGTTIQRLLFDPKGFLDQAQGSEERKYHEKLLSTLTPTGNW